MLLRFSVGNVACFDERVTLDMVASDEQRLRSAHVVEGTPPTVRLAALYGANAAGKTRFTAAMAQSRGLILDGTRPHHRLPLDFHRLRRDAREGPAVFEYVVRTDNRIWTYGFAATRERIVEEWLFLGPPEAERTLFTRDGRKSGAGVTLGADLIDLSERDDAESRLRFLVEGTRINQLFLTELWERDHPVIQPLMAWFDSGFVTIQAAARYLPLEARSRREMSFTAALGTFLSAAATGIEAVSVNEQPFEPSQLAAEVVDQILEMPELDDGILIDQSGDYRLVHRNSDGKLIHTRLSAERRDDQGEAVHFDFAEESAGTRQLMNLFPILADGGEAPRTIVVDELDRMLHPSLSRAFIELFIRQSHPESQLVFTTHESRLMKRDVMRQDEIWVFEKTRSGASRLKPMSDFDIPEDMDLDTAYLAGRFGGVPYLEKLRRLGES